MAYRNRRRAAINGIKNLAVAAMATAIATLLGACSNYESLPPQAIDREYHVLMVTVGQGDLKLFLIKAFEVDGKVAMCGGFTSGGSAISNNASRTFADVSQVYLDGTKIGNSDFLNMMPVYFRQGDSPEDVWTELLAKQPATNCVKSDIDWRPQFRDGEFESKGPSSVTVFD